MKKIREAREAAHFTLRQVAGPLGRTSEWVRRIEIGTLRASQDVSARILHAIEKLSAIKVASEAQAARELSDVRIPRKRARELASGKR